MPTPVTHTFLLISYNDKNKIDGAATFESTPATALADGQARAKHAGSHKFKVFRIVGDNDGLTFAAVENRK